MAGRPKSQGPTKDQKVTLRLTSDINSELKRIALETGRQVSQILAELVADFIKQNPLSF